MPKRSLCHAFRAIGIDSVKSTPEHTSAGVFVDLPDSDEKHHVNIERIARSIASASSDGLVVVLDGDTFATTRALLDAGIPGWRVHVVERDPERHCRHRAHPMAQRVFTYECDLFAFLRMLHGAGLCVAAIVADLMQPSVDEAQCQLLDAERVFVTLSGRDRAGRSIAERIEATRRAMRTHLRLVYGYRRSTASMPMYLLEFRRDAGPIEYRPRIIHERRAGKCLVQWYGYPERRDWTWEVDSFALY